MELAFQHITRRRRSRTGDDTCDLLLLDTVTGRRRLLAERVSWLPPRWSADGRWVRFEQRLPRRGFVVREVEVDSGALTDAVPHDLPDGSVLPGYSDCLSPSPLGHWLVYRDHNCLLRAARPDGSDAHLLRLAFQYFAADSFWSPCGTRLAVHLTAGQDTGTYVVDLRSGGLARVSPDPENYFVNGWSADAQWLATTKNRWHNPKTYDYEWHELWLLAADGTAARQLTDDGLCRHPAIRPNEAAPISREHELTFVWSQRLHSPQDPPAAGEALSALIRLDLDAGPPLDVIVVARTAGQVTEHVLTGAASIPDGFAELDAFLLDTRLRPAGNFTVVLPRYAGDSPTAEQAILQIAHAVLAATQDHGWRFARDLP